MEGHLQEAVAEQEEDVKQKKETFSGLLSSYIQHLLIFSAVKFEK